MMKMIRLYVNLLLTRKVMYIFVGEIIMISIVLLLLSEFYTNPNDLEVHRELYAYNYLLEGGILLKIIIVLQAMFVNIGLSSITIDSLLLSRFNRKQVIVSKTASLLIINILLTSIFLMLLFLIGQFVAGYLNAIPYQMFLNFILLSAFYTIIGELVMNLFITNYALIGVLVLYIISSIFSPLEKMDHYTIVERLMGFIIPDVMFQNGSFVFLYGGIFVFTSTVVYFMIVVQRYKKNDIIIF